MAEPGDIVGCGNCGMPVFRRYAYCPRCKYGGQGNERKPLPMKDFDFFIGVRNATIISVVLYAIVWAVLKVCL